MSSAETKRRGRPADTAKHLAILEAAGRSFFDCGYAATSIERVAEKAGVSKVTVYNHFGDKRGLFSAAVEAECEKIRSLLLFDDAQGELPDRLIAFGHAMLAFLTRPEMIRFEQRIAAETEKEPELGVAFLEAGPRRMHRALTGLLERAQSRGELAFDDAALAGEQLASMFKGLSDLERRFAGIVDRPAAERRVRAAVDLFLRAYATDGEAKPISPGGG